MSDVVINIGSLVYRCITSRINTVFPLYNICNNLNGAYIFAQAIKNKTKILCIRKQRFWIKQQKIGHLCIQHNFNIIHN